ncbi:MAG: peptidoglycan DD-metalloendopeptidase family protein [Bacteroidales bacterium]|nr:peptidoglycan DD-metalloendopeptidase family protein [Bacteroidales bacterium]
MQNFQKIYIKHLFIVTFFLFFLFSFSQNDKTKLENEKKKILDEINYTNNLIDKTNKNKQISINQLFVINNKIKKREQLISFLKDEISSINNKIDSNNKKIKELSDELSALKKEYAKMIYYAFKNKNSYDRMMFVFSSKDFNQAYQRMKYFQQYSSYRKLQASLIKSTQEEINNKTDDLKTQKEKKIEIQIQEKKEKNTLFQDKKDQNETINKLKQKEKKLRKDLRDKQKAANKLQKTIENIIAAEIKKAKEKTTDTKTKTYANTPEDVELSKTFSANKGKLPWPTESGIISSTFGEHPHPVLKRIKTKNNGIDILTNEGEKVRAVFDGVVSNILLIPNLNTVVIIKHGEYLTVYSNLSKVYVEKGDRVKTKQNIGIIHTNKSESKSELNFQIWKGQQLQNPAYWIKK